jgi:predicted RNA-binding Zn ribbon-like protein
MDAEIASTNGLARGWVLPGEPLPVRFMNTIWADRRGIHDDLTLPVDVTDWLYKTGLLAVEDHPASAADLRQARRLRDACRRLAAHVTADGRTPAASAIEDVNEAIIEINAAAAAHPPIPRLVLRHGDLSRSQGQPGAALPNALTVLASAAIDLFTDEDAPPLLACQAPGCVLYFVREHPRREWCSPACGNRARAARHYQRHRGSDLGPN